MLIPGAILVCGISRVFFKAACITDKCKRVPSLINSCSFGEAAVGDIDTERQYVVGYILNSRAGFYIFETRLTSVITIKFAYACAVCLFTLATHIVSEEIS